MSESKSMILGMSGTKLTADERAFFADERPWGYILFARNIADAAQLSALVDELRAVSGNGEVPILIDQEGGRVQRLRPPLAPNYPVARRLGELYRLDQDMGCRAAWLMSRLHAFDLCRYGINVDCLPVLDIPVPGSHDVIGDRAYGDDPQTVIALGRAAMEGLLAGGVLPVVKHVPGHGRAGSDTHLELPVVDTARSELERTDFAPFRALRGAPLAMTAHVVYADIDAARPATTSRRVIDQVIRHHMGYDGLLMSDDVSMKALEGRFEDRTRAIFEAGCDVVLHCNGDMAEMQAVACETPLLSGDARRRGDTARSLIGRWDDLQEDNARLEFDSLVAATV
jgi:beta-N-acetylhexosaminidase